VSFIKTSFNDYHAPLYQTSNVALFAIVELGYSERNLTKTFKFLYSLILNSDILKSEETVVIYCNQKLNNDNDNIKLQYHYFFI